MSREKELAKNTFLLTLGRFLPKLVQVITLPITTACLTKSEYGTHDLIATLVMLLLPIATLQIQSAAFRFLIECRNDKHKTSEIISNILVVVWPVSLLVSILVMIFYPGISIPFRLILGAYFLLDMTVIILGQIARGMGKTKAYTIGSITLSWTNAVGIVLALKLMNKGLTGLYFSLVVAQLVAVSFYATYLKIWRFIHPGYVSGAKIKEMLSYSWPMIPNSLSNWVLKISDRMVIAAHLGLEAAAVYGVANKIPNILAIAHTVVVNAWQESASMTVNDADVSEYYSSMFDRIFSMLVGVTAALIGFMPLLFKLLIRGDYGEAYVNMPILILGMFFFSLAGFQGGIYVAHKKTKSVGFTTIAAAAINLTIDFLLVRRIGVLAGSISTLTAYLALYVFRAVASRKFQPMHYNIKKQAMQYAILAAMLAICFIRNPYLNWLNMALGITFFLLYNRRLIERVLRKFLRKGKKKQAAELAEQGEQDGIND